ncbi:hypothetical protein B0H14DRAFT_2581532 [Mycena olivaceomarginata]|nr:hypothetical protein B0H14DRAFT_2581532 [Mycena olivaceomarginata]
MFWLWLWLFGLALASENLKPGQAKLLAFRRICILLPLPLPPPPPPPSFLCNTPPTRCLISALAYQQRAQVQPQKQTTLFVGSISGGITDATFNHLLTACGSIKLFKHLTTPANKPQGSGFAEFEEPDGPPRAPAPPNNTEPPAPEDGHANNKLLLPDPSVVQTSKAAIDTLVADINRVAADTSSQKEKRRTSPRHSGLGISEITQFRECATKREREKMRELQAQIPTPGGAPSGPKMREWRQPKEVEAWDDDESDELFYIDRARWHAVRVWHLATEQSAAFKQEEAANLMRESEDFFGEADGRDAGAGGGAAARGAVVGSYSNGYERAQRSACARIDLVPQLDSARSRILGSSTLLSEVPVHSVH